MAQRKPAPRLLVKIVGSKQVKQFMEEPPAEAGGETLQQKNDQTPAGGEATEAQRRAGSGLWAVINQVPDRQCVTAPPGDRSRSFIHPRAAARESGAARQLGASSEDGDEAELSAAVREQLSGWPLSSLASVEVAAALDGSSGGKLDRSALALLFLNGGVPLKLPTFSLLLQMFSEDSDPDQIHYENLLQFIRAAALPEELELNKDDEDHQENQS